MIETFLLYHRDPLGVMTRVTQVPAKRVRADRLPDPACSLRLIQEADRIVGVDDEGLLTYVYKERGNEADVLRLHDLLNQHQRRRQAKRLAWAWALLEHVETFGVLIATREPSGHINILAHGNFRMNILGDGKHEFIGVATNDATERDQIIEVKL